LQGWEFKKGWRVRGLEVWRGIEFIEFVGFFEFIGLMEQSRVEGCILFAGGNAINTTNTRHTINT